MKAEKEITTRSITPFDDSATELLCRMGLLEADGSANVGAVMAISRVYAGMFYDDLLDFCDDLNCVKAMCCALIERTRFEESKRSFIAICMVYDTMRKPLPEPIWWLSGNMTLVPLFVECFMKCISEFTESVVE